VTESEIDKDFLSQIDRVDELISLIEKLDDDVLICECFCVNTGDIREVCQSLKAFDLKTVQESFNLGLGCQGCLKKIDTWVNKIF
jgi:NAD(P)H-nitrite reductase large subunit